MLELKGIKKDYSAGENTVHALKGIDLRFRKSEFVSILGPSGCGKTTMLNIIGGLDQYTSGDLVINGVSTRNYKDRDWDGYRNHSVGFVFQSYNLIPHQSVLQNVELALTLSGVSKAERKKRAVSALERVGLGDQIRKKPNELSGGQMQRVAIARAIVNDPDIILADEPTGALDSETSVQVMDILKEIARDRLVVMVTHNPQLAEEYSTRIVTMLDGIITSDSDPLTEEDIKKEEKYSEKKREQDKGAKKPSMSFVTSFGLSLKNLFTKKGRTALTSFAGSIGIIGIALIYAVSNGMTAYIDAVQEDTLSSYPLTLQSSHIDLSTIMLSFIDSAISDEKHELDGIYQKDVIYDMVNAMNSIEARENDLEAFKKFLEEKRADKDDPLHTALSGIQYTYDNDLIVYTKNVDGDIIASDMEELMRNILIKYFGQSNMLSSSSSLTSSPMSSMMGGSSMGRVGLWQEMLPGFDGKLINPVLEKQYDVIYGSWPTEYNEVVIVVDSNNEIDDMTLYALGLRSEEEIDAIADAAFNKTDIKADGKKWTYEEICDMTFRTILPADCFIYDESKGIYTDLRKTEAGMKYLYDNGLELKVSGIIRPSETAVSSMLTGTVAYTSELTKYIINNSTDSPAVKAQLEDPDTDIFTALRFKDSIGDLSAKEKEEALKAHISELDSEGKAQMYISIMSVPTQETVDKAIDGMMGSMTRKDMEEAMKTALSAQMGMAQEEVAKYLSAMTDEDLKEIFTKAFEENFRQQYAQGVRQQMSAMSSEQLSMALTMAINKFTEEQFALYYDEVMEFSSSTYENNLTTLGYLDLDDPSSINLFASSFAEKDIIEEAIKTYNDSVDEMERIEYADYVGLMMSSITTIINAITYVLIAFVAVSLIVSSIMIGVITLISVQERTKEIGILRAIGASKKNVSGMFNAETVIIGFTSGALGVIVTYLLCIPINMILNFLTGISNLDAILPLPVGLILIAISVILTLIAGIIPSRSAAKKDPVVALRTE